MQRLERLEAGPEIRHDSRRRCLVSSAFSSVRCLGDERTWKREQKQMSFQNCDVAAGFGWKMCTIESWNSISENTRKELEKFEKMQGTPRRQNPALHAACLFLVLPDSEHALPIARQRTALVPYLASQHPSSSIPPLERECTPAGQHPYSIASYTCRQPVTSMKNAC